MDKRNWYTGQVVQESHMDTAFDNVETAIQRTYSDAGIRGITSGLGVTAGAGTKEVVLGTGVAYDIYGRRIPVSAVQTIDLTVDSTSAPITNPSGTNVRWVSVFVKFEISETGLAVDGGGNEILTQTSDSFSIVVKQAAEGPLISATRPTADSDEVKCADIKLELGTGVIPPGNIELTYADLAFEATKLDSSVVGGKTLDAALTAIYQDVEALVQGVTDGVDTLSGEVDAIDIRLTAVETAVDINGTTELMPAPGGDLSHNYPYRDSEISTRSLEFDNALAFSYGLTYLRLAEKLRPAGIPDGATFSGESPSLTTNELLTQLPLFQPKETTWTRPTSTIPCLLLKLPLTSGDRYIRLYTYHYGFILSCNCYIINPDATLSWTRDTAGVSAYDTTSWAVTSGSLIAFSASNGLKYLFQDYTRPNTWDFDTVGVGGWESETTIV